METSLNTEGYWAMEEFGHAELGNLARTRRLVAVAENAASHPAGCVTEVFDKSSEREGAYRMLENSKVKSNNILESTAQATARRCCREDFVFVPVDGTSLNLPDPSNVRGMGTVGPYAKGAEGLAVMNAIAVAPDGTPLGILDQEYWVREKDKARKKQRKQRPLEDKETRYWLNISDKICELLKEHGDNVTPWFQFDRGGDFREALDWASQTDAKVTVRAAQNRRVADEESRLLWEQVERQEIAGIYELDVMAGPRRKARLARMELRFCTTTLILSDPSRKEKPKEINLTAVYARENGTTPEGEKPISWLLLSNQQSSCFDEAKVILDGYSQRWKIEEFHKSWKTTCKVEDTQLRSVESVKKWAIILAAVAVRVERLKYLARHSPDEKATVEFSALEVEAIIVLKKPNGFSRTDVPSLGQAVSWVADIGGYTGKSSGGPPGAVVIGRGLKRIEPVVTALANIAGFQ